MNCPNCGRELAEGEVCTCTQQQAAYYNPNATQQPYYNQQPQGNYAYPPQQPYYVPETKQPASTEYPEGYKIKKKYVAVILGACLGTLGIHNFYLGNNSKAIAQILLSTVGALLLVGPIASLIWSLVETVLILTEDIDADANNFKIQTFEESLAKKLNK